MGRFFELIAIAIFVGIVFRRIVSPFLRGISGVMGGPQQAPRRGPEPQPQPKVPEQKPGPMIDRTKVQDASYRDLD